MSNTFKQRLNLLRNDTILPQLTRIKRGIEKEALRTTPAGKLAQTAHPQALGSTLTHPSITTDYSEALLEFITPALESPEEAIDYLIQNTPNPEYDAIKAIERYIAMPGQATAYMIGKLKIMELRETAKATLGDKFSYPEFHDVVLKDGPVPLSVLEEKVNQWVTGKL